MVWVNLSINHPYHLWCFTQFGSICNLEKVKNTFGGVLLPHVTLLHSCFSRFLNCRNGTKSHKTYLIFCDLQIPSSEMVKTHWTWLKEILRFAVMKWVKIRLKTSAMAGEKIRIYPSQMHNNTFFWWKYSGTCPCFLAVNHYRWQNKYLR